MTCVFLAGVGLLWFALSGGHSEDYLAFGGQDGSKKSKIEIVSSGKSSSGDLHDHDDSHHNRDVLEKPPSLSSSDTIQKQKKRNYPWRLPSG